MNELIQEIITFVIITSTATYSIYQITLFFIPSKNKGICSSCMNGSCGIKENKLTNENPIRLKGIS